MQLLEGYAPLPLLAQLPMIFISASGVSHNRQCRLHRIAIAVAQLESGSSPTSAQ